MLTPRDKAIIFHIERYGFCTISQAFQIWFNDRKYGYDLARKHLNKCVSEGHIKGFKQTATIMYTEKIFYIEDKYSHPSRSMIITMNVYAELVRLGADMIHFKREESWLDGKYRSDAFVIMSIGDNIFSSCIEVTDSTKLSYTAHRNSLIKKYTEIYSEDEPLKKLMDITNLNRKFTPPKLIVISEIAKANLEIEEIEIVSIDYSLQKLSQMFTTKII